MIDNAPIFHEWCLYFEYIYNWLYNGLILIHLHRSRNIHEKVNQ